MKTFQLSRDPKNDSAFGTRCLFKLIEHKPAQLALRPGSHHRIEAQFDKAWAVTNFGCRACMIWGISGRDLRTCSTDFMSEVRIGNMTDWLGGAWASPRLASHFWPARLSIPAGITPAMWVLNGFD